MIKLCVFDLAGTTLKDDGNIVASTFQKAFIKYGFQVSLEQVNEFMGMPKPLAIENVLIKNDLLPEGDQFNTINTINTIHSTFVQLMREHYATHQDVAEIDGASNLFSYLQSKDIAVAIDTGFSKDITNVIIDRMGWIKNGLVETVVSSDEVTNGRPYPDMIQEIMRRLSITDSKTIAKIGDTPADLIEGYNAGCGLIVGVTEGSHSKEQLEKYTYATLIPNVTYLNNLL